jgi:hypothetical protein
MNGKELRPQNAFKRWIFPTGNNLCAWSRIIFGVLCDAALILFVVSRSQLLNNTQNVRYETIDWVWTWIVSLGPCFPIVVLVPVMILSKSAVQRWIAIVLIPLPVLIVLFEWLQLLIVAHVFMQILFEVI